MFEHHLFIVTEHGMGSFLMMVQVELQVPIPVEMEGSDGATTVNAQHMQVDTQDRTLSTTVQTSQVDNSSSQHHASMVG
jgi:hypothetical protein